MTFLQTLLHLLSLSLALSLVAASQSPFSPVLADQSPLPSLPSTIPHCTHTSLLTADITRESAETATIDMKLALDETACLRVRVNESSVGNNTTKLRGNALLYTLTYSSLKSTYAMRTVYKFGIPHLRSECICDCPGGDTHCTPTKTQNDECDVSDEAGSLCYNTLHSHAAPIGCAAGSEARVCCKVIVKPYKEWVMQAISVALPKTVVTFAFDEYMYSEGRWRRVQTNDIHVNINQAQTFNLHDGDTTVQVTGVPPISVLSPADNYLKLHNESTLRTGVPVNRRLEWNTGKLGWLRYHDAQWSIRKGRVTIQSLHNMRVLNCQEQIYTDAYNAEYYVTQNRSTSDGREDVLRNFHLGHTVEAQEKSVRSVVADVKHRQVTVTHSRSAYMTVDMQLSSKARVTLMHHQSHLGDFTSVIQLDSLSNRFLNVTFFDAVGTLIGSSYASDARRHIDIAFSAYITSTDQSASSTASTIITLPPSVNSSRWVCFHAAGRQSEEICKWAKYVAAPMHKYIVPHGWAQNRGSCDNCNAMGVQNLVKYLNPKEWLNGVSSASETFAIALEVVIYAIVALLIITLVRRCLWPLLNWTICKGGMKRKKKKTKKCDHTHT